MDVKSIDVQVRWVMVTDEDGTSYEYPAKVSRYIKKTYSGPAIYRWRVIPSGEDGRETVYIGQAEDLAQRVQRVLTPGHGRKGDPTDRRLQTAFRELLSKRKKMVLEIADFEEFEINGVHFSPSVLADRFRRLAVENLILAVQQAAGYNLLNKVEDLKRKQFWKMLRKMPARERSQLLEKLAPDLMKLRIVEDDAKETADETKEQSK